MLKKRIVLFIVCVIIGMGVLLYQDSFAPIGLGSTASQSSTPLLSVPVVTPEPTPTPEPTQTPKSETPSPDLSNQRMFEVREPDGSVSMGQYPFIESLQNK